MSYTAEDAFKILKGYGLATSLQATRKLIREKKLVADLPAQGYKRGGYTISKENLRLFIKENAPKTLELINEIESLKEEIDDLKKDSHTGKRIERLSRNDLRKLKGFTKEEKEWLIEYIFDFVQIKEITAEEKITIAFYEKNLEAHFREILDYSMRFYTFRLLQTEMEEEEQKKLFSELVGRIRKREVTDVQY